MKATYVSKFELWHQGVIVTFEFSFELEYCVSTMLYNFVNFE